MPVVSDICFLTVLALVMRSGAISQRRMPWRFDHPKPELQPSPPYGVSRLPGLWPFQGRIS